MLWLLLPLRLPLRLSMSKQSKFRHSKLQLGVLISCYIVVGCCMRSAFALRCYTCSYALNESNDTTCVHDAKSTERITDCDKKYCTIMRQEAKSPAGKVISFTRDCQDKPLFLNKLVEDETFKSYYRSCQTDLCNDASGKSTASVNVDPNSGAAQNAIIKGRDAAAAVHVNGKLLGGALAALLCLVTWRCRS